MSYRIASFNIQHFSYVSVGAGDAERAKKDLDTIAAIIRDNDIDIIGIQEISSKEALKTLLERISNQYAVEDRLVRKNIETGTYNVSNNTGESFGYITKHWEGRWAKPKGSTRVSEGYAFIWNRDRIQLVTNHYGKKYDPRIVDYKESENLVRPPFVGRFMPINSRYEFRLINTHIIHNTSKNEDEDKEDAISGVDYAWRKAEFDKLIQLYVKYSSKVFDVTGHDTFARSLSPYTFLLGDYNLNLSQAKGRSGARLEPQREYVTTSNGNMHIITVNDKLTTLRGKPKDPEKARELKENSEISAHMSNNYDHFTYDCKRLYDNDISNPVDNVINPFVYFVDTGEDSKFDIYRTKVSDHIPIYLEFDIRKRPSKERL